MAIISQINIFKCILYSEKVLIPIKILLQFVSKSNWQYASISLDNGLAAKRQKAIIWSNGGVVYWRIYASLGLNELLQKRLNSSVLAVKLGLLCIKSLIHVNSLPVRVSQVHMFRVINY